MTAHEIESWILSKLANHVYADPDSLDPDIRFAEIGLSSKDALMLVGELQDHLSIPLPETLPWDHPTVREMARHLSGLVGEAKEPARPAGIAGADGPAMTTEPVAVVGMACTFPGAPDADALWSLIEAGGDGLAVPGRDVPGRPQGLLPGIDQFDAGFFAVSDAEAPFVDPQQRLLLETAWRALEDAAISPAGLAGTRTGVFIGVSGSDYGRLQRADTTPLSRFSGTGQAASITANRLSYLLDLRGVSLAVDTACSSSLVAVHLALRSLRSAESDLALCGGVSVLLATEITDAFAAAGMMARDGRCKTFDAAADGYVRSEGCGVIVLKRLSDAVRDQDRILGVIAGSAVGQDGRSNGLTAPRGPAQEAVIRDALRDAALTPADIGYVEAHGTGTPLGDPIEVSAIGAVLAGGRSEEQPLFIGSAKASIGHAEAAAGIAGLIKILLMLRHRRVPGQVHLRELNPRFPATSSVHIATHPRDWVAAGPGRVLAAGVSSFGFGGTNAHAIVREMLPAELPGQVGGDDLAVAADRDAAPERPLHLLALSARSESALTSSASRYAGWLRAHPDCDLAAMARTTTRGRAHFRYRAAVTAAGYDEALAGLDLLAGSGTSGARAGLIHRGQARSQPGKLAMLFSGQGSQYLHMGRQLYVTNSVFRAHLHQCQQLLDGYLDVPLLSVLFPVPGQHELLDRTRYTQPALVAVEYALAQVWRSWGVVPDYVLGHSIGEVAAACVAGVLELADALRLAAERGRLIEELCEPGSMAIVFDDEQVVRSALAGSALAGSALAVAAVNAADVIVVGGRPADLRAFVAELAERGITTRPVKSQYAFHSELMRPVLGQLASVAASITHHRPSIPVVSDLDGCLFGEGGQLDAGYWPRHLLNPVRFAAGARVLAEQGCDRFLEVGPGQALVAAGVRTVPDGLWRASLRAEISDWSVLTGTVAGLYAAGQDIDWDGFHDEGRHDRLALPGYPFERRRHWLDEATDRKQLGHNQAGSGQVDPVLALLNQAISGLLGERSVVDPDTAFVELGADSMALFQLGQAAQKAFDVAVPVNQLFGELNTLNRLAAHIRQTASAGLLAALAGEGNPAGDVNSAIRDAMPGPPAMAAGAAADGAVGQFLQVHAQVMNQAFELLRGHPGDNGHPDGNGQRPVLAPALPAVPSTHPVPPAPPGTFVPFRPVQRMAADGLAGAQAAYVEQLVGSYSARTRRSKELAAAERARHADLRHALQPYSELKQITYPIVVDRSSGSHVWDIDGNEYVDLTMGFGVNLFGHQEPFITSAIAQQLSAGMQLGPHSPLAAEVSRLICEMTGQQRAVFCNTGSEAVMVAIRLARAVTGKSRIALFAGSYHGSADTILAQQLVQGEYAESVPMAPGITEDVSRNILVLPYGADAALEAISAYADELAAVLVEPVQSRHPDLLPVPFLRRLRDQTQASGIALIFDEVITGFRMHPGGMQAILGIRADITTYGKIVGGGLPIGVVAGDSRYLDAIDGGAWQFDETHYPESVRTFFTGTFAKHPLALAAARAVLGELRRRGPGLQAELEARTASLAERANAAMVRAGAPARVARYGSLFRFQFPAKGDKSLTSELFYASLIDKGVYVWEGRNCFLSVAHTDADIDRIVDVVSQTASEMAEAGLFGHVKAGTSTAGYPLSQVQREMWLLDRMSPDLSRAYTEGLVLDLRGELDAEAMRSAVQSLVARHDSLHAIIDSDGSRQRVVEPQSDLQFVDFSDLPERERPEHLDAWYEAQATEVVGLGARPPVRFALLRLAAGHHQLYVAIHHAMIDGWSYELLLSEIAAMYRGYVRGVPEPLPEVVQYREHVAWEQGRPSQDGTADSAYWRDQFPDGVPELVLRAGRAPSSTNRRLGLLRHVISPDATSRLSGVFGQLGVTPFAVLLAAYGYLLHRVSDQDDLVIAVPFACRDYPGGTRVVGNCSTTLPVRSVIRPRLAVRDYIRSMHDSLLASSARPGFSISALQEQASRADGARSRVFAALINLDNASTMPDFGGPEASVAPAPKRFAQADLSFDVLRDSDGLRLTVEYDADLLDEADVYEYAGIFDRLLTQLLADPDALLEEIALGRAGETADHPIAAESLPDAGTLTGIVERQVRQNPDAPALWHEDEQLTYDELNRRANRLARHLVTLGAGPGSIVTLAIPRSLELAVGILAVIKAGAAYHALDVDEPPARIAGILADVDPVAVLTVADLAGTGVEPGRAGAVVLDDADTANLIAGLDDANLTDAGRLAPLTGADIAYVIYTSGSTGRPKGVMVPHSGIVNTLRWWWRGELALTPDDRTMFKTPLTADTSVKELFLPLTVGAAVIIARHGEHANAAYLASLIQRTGTTTVEFVPTTLRDFLAEPGAADCVSLRHVLCGGEPLTTDLANRCHQTLRAELINLYGPTEASVEVTFWQSRPGLPDAAAPIGRPIGGTGLYVLDPRLREVPAGVLGELYIAGASLARGYLGRPGITSERFIACPFGVPGERMYRTGDLVRRSADGQLHFAGRADAQVQMRGVRVELGEIEAALCALDPVAAAAVVQRDVDGKPQLVGYVVVTPDDQDGDRAGLAPSLLGQLRRVLPRAMMPARIVVVPGLPRLSSGKADRRALESLPLGPATTTAARPPRTPTEVRLRDLWCEFLERADVGTNEDFFALGGESLIAARLSNHIKEQFEVDVPVAKIFEHSTIQELAAYLDDSDRSALAGRPALTRRARS